ncbi:HNH endonuclease [Rhizobium mesoamericanum]|nr:HNH endonuclease [Rhizobium mesoamericanum]
MSKDSADRYAVMQQPAPGEQVFHLVAGVSATDPRQRVIYGVSRVAIGAEVTRSKPPSPGHWGDAEAYFRIALADFSELAVKLPTDEVEASLSDIILADLSERPKHYPYAPYRDGFRGAQGIYLAKLSPALTEAFRAVIGFSTSSVKHVDEDGARGAIREFAEGERARREGAFFKRNPTLRAAAIEAHGLRCVACSVSFQETYGPLGEGYIEIHHLNPLAERRDFLNAEPTNTKVEDVAPLCANCHRMVHRRRPALSLDELRDAIYSASAERYGRA